MNVKVTVDYTHEVQGSREAATAGFTRPTNDGKAFTDEAFRGYLTERLERELHAVKPVVVTYAQSV